LGLKFWLWPLETIIHRFYSEGFENKIFTRPNIYAYVFRKLNSIIRFLRFCEGKSSLSKHIFMKFGKFLWYTYNSLAPIS
jgi:hypothetical protein